MRIIFILLINSIFLSSSWASDYIDSLGQEWAAEKASKGGGLITNYGGNSTARAMVASSTLESKCKKDWKSLGFDVLPDEYKSIPSPDFDPYALTAEQVQVPFTTHMNEADEGRLNSMEDVQVMQYRYKCMPYSLAGNSRLKEYVGNISGTYVLVLLIVGFIVLAFLYRAPGKDKEIPTPVSITNDDSNQDNKADEMVIVVRDQINEFSSSLKLQNNWSLGYVSGIATAIARGIYKLDPVDDREEYLSSIVATLGLIYDTNADVAIDLFKQTMELVEEDIEFQTSMKIAFEDANQYRVSGVKPTSWKEYLGKE